MKSSILSLQQIPEIEFECLIELPANHHIDRRGYNAPRYFRKKGAHK